MFSPLCQLPATTPAHIAAWQAAAAPGPDAFGILEAALKKGLPYSFTLPDEAGLPRSLAEQIAWKAPKETLRERFLLLQQYGWDVHEIPPGACTLSLVEGFTFNRPGGRLGEFFTNFANNVGRAELYWSDFLKEERDEVRFPHLEDWKRQPSFLHIVLTHFSLKPETRGAVLADVLCDMGLSLLAPNHADETVLDILLFKARHSEYFHMERMLTQLLFMMERGVPSSTVMTDKSVKTQHYGKDFEESLTLKAFFEHEKVSGYLHHTPTLARRLEGVYLKEAIGAPKEVDQLSDHPRRPRL